MASGPSSPPRGIPAAAWPCLTAVLFVVAMVAWRYDGTTGLTSLLQFGAPFEDRRLPALAGEPMHVFPNPGYDGQFYAQLAVDPDVTKPEVQAALDNPRYRARRILLPAVVHVLGAGDATLTLNLFALSNLAAWLAAGWLLWRRVGNDGRRGAAVWLACMLSLGALDSVRLSLVDMPALLLVFLAIEASVRGRRLPALAALGAAVLTRESSLLATGAVEGGPLRSGVTWFRHVANGLLIVAPLALWMGWLAFNVPEGNTTGSGNFAAPFAAIARHVGGCLREIASGSDSLRHVFGLVAVPGLLLQAGWVAYRAVKGGLAADPWIRAALPFVLLLLVLGDSVWHGYWAVARVCLPLTFAFNLSLPRDGRFWWWLAAGNAFALHGIHRLLPD